MKPHELLQKCCDQLMEHYDTVQVFVTKHDGETHYNAFGRGNMYAREGQVRDWLTRGDEQARVNQRREEND